MKLLSIDPSIKNLGYAFFDNQALVSHGVFKSDANETIAKRLTFLLRGLDATGNVWGAPDAVVIESPPSFTYGRSARHGKTLNADAMNKLWMTIGALLAHYEGLNVPVELTDVMKWKGQQGKGVAKMNAKLLYELDVNDHIADAIMLGHHYLSTKRMQERIRA